MFLLMHEIFEQWKEANEEAREKMFIDFMNKNVNLNKVDESIYDNQWNSGTTSSHGG